MGNLCGQSAPSVPPGMLMERKHIQETVIKKLLLLGNVSAGKSIVYRHLSLLSTNEISAESVDDFKSRIRINCITGMIKLIKQASFIGLVDQDALRVRYNIHCNKFKDKLAELVFFYAQQQISVTYETTDQQLRPPTAKSHKADTDTAAANNISNHVTEVMSYKNNKLNTVWIPDPTWAILDCNYNYNRRMDELKQTLLKHIESFCVNYNSNYNYNYNHDENSILNKAKSVSQEMDKNGNQKNTDADVSIMKLKQEFSSMQRFFDEINRNELVTGGNATITVHDHRSNCNYGSNKNKNNYHSHHNYHSSNFNIVTCPQAFICVDLNKVNINIKSEDEYGPYINELMIQSLIKRYDLLVEAYVHPQKLLLGVGYLRVSSDAYGILFNPTDIGSIVSRYIDKDVIECDRYTRKPNDKKFETFLFRNGFSDTDNQVLLHHALRTLQRHEREDFEWHADMERNFRRLMSHDNADDDEYDIYDHDAHNMLVNSNCNVNYNSDATNNDLNNSNYAACNDVHIDHDTGNNSGNISIDDKFNISDGKFIEVVFNKCTKEKQKELIKAMESLREFRMVLTILWQNNAIYYAWYNHNRKLYPFQFNDNMDYFYKQRIGDIFEFGYTPTLDDYLKCRERTTGFYSQSFINVKELGLPISDVEVISNDDTSKETEPAKHSEKNVELGSTKANSIQFDLWDVGGSRFGRKKWVHAAQGVDCVLFVAGLNHYSKVLLGDDHVNSMIESIDLFHRIVSGKWFKQSEIILLLNKDDLFRKCIMDDIPLKLCFSSDNCCTIATTDKNNDDNNNSKHQYLHFWDCTESMIELIAKKLNFENSINHNNKKASNNDDNYDCYNVVNDAVRVDDGGISNLGIQALNHSTNDDDIQLQWNNQLISSSNTIRNTKFATDNQLQYRDTYLDFGGMKMQQENQYCSIDGTFVSHGKLNQSYTFDEKSNTIKRQIVDVNDENDSDEYDYNYKFRESHTLMDTSIKVYPNPQLRFGSKRVYCHGKFGKLTDDEWFEFVYENYLHFIIKMYKSIEVKGIKRKLIYSHVVNATEEICVRHIFKDIQSVLIKDSVISTQNI